MIVKPGERLASPVCPAQLVVVRAPAGGLDLDLRFGGRPAVTPGGEPAERGEPDPDLVGELPMGRRLADEVSGLEVLVTRAGTGLVTVDGRRLAERGAKALPASD